MISINVPNIITVVLIAVLGRALIKFGLGKFGMNPSWL